MVVLAAAICTRGGKAVLSRHFREIPRSRVEALLASLPNLAGSGTQHTTVEQDNVRFVYQPLDELYMVLITNPQSNILQDIETLHLFSQVVSNTCKSLDEREIVKNTFELLSAFDELVTLGYRENLTLSQIRTFLEMESHEERIQEIISRNKELEATEERKRKAKQLELQRKEAARSGRGSVPRTPVYPSYTPPARSNVPDPTASYEAEKNKSYSKPDGPKIKGMQLGKKSKTTNMFERVRGDLGGDVDDTPLVTPTPAAQPALAQAAATHDGVHVTITETVNARISEDGDLAEAGVSGELTLRVGDPSASKVRLDLTVLRSDRVKYSTHPKVDSGVFKSSNAVQPSNAGQRFPVGKDAIVLRWEVSPGLPAAGEPNPYPLTIRVWPVRQGDSDRCFVTIEYELDGNHDLADVLVQIPLHERVPLVTSTDAIYEVSDEALEWHIGAVSEHNTNGIFEFEVESDGGTGRDLYPMSVTFKNINPSPYVDVNDVLLVEENESIEFTRDVKPTSEIVTIQ